MMSVAVILCAALKQEGELVKSRGFSLLELIIVTVIVGILVAMAIPQFARTREQALQKDALANLRLIQAAERGYRLENNAREFGDCNCVNTATCNAADGCNSRLRMSLSPTEWSYSVAGDANSFTATAVRLTGPTAGCTYTIDQDDIDPVFSSGGCL
jgi:type IV pilus assembly protein PilA